MRNPDVPVEPNRLVRRLGRQKLQARPVGVFGTVALMPDFFQKRS
jgi:hypothetical protein